MTKVPEMSILKTTGYICVEICSKTGEKGKNPIDTTLQMCYNVTVNIICKNLVIKGEKESYYIACYGFDFIFISAHDERQKRYVCI